VIRFCLLPSILESARVKIERASKHIVDLEAAIAKFFERRPYSVVAYIDADRRATYCLKHIEPIDLCIPAIAGDAIQNLRTALDYLAGALWRRTNSGEWKGYFPISDSAAKYKAEGLGKMKGMGQDAIDAIDAVEPYGGGKGDMLWRLHSLSIIDKHRLPLTVAGANLGIHLPSLYPELFPKSAKSNQWILGVADFRCPLKDDDILFRDDPGREIKQNLQLPFFVALNEVGVFNCQPLIPALKNMVEVADHVINGFAPLFP
jgi:hypothetical protein